MSDPEGCPRIVVVRDGPYLIEGGVALVRKSQVVSERGEPLTWRKEGTIQTPPAAYALCRCGQSGRRPFCDGTHACIDFDGTESADTGTTVERRVILRSDPWLVVWKDISLCMDSGYCGLRGASLEQFLEDSEETRDRLVALTMVEHCPSGALTYRMAASQSDIEPDLAVEVSDTTEITSQGAIAGPLWVTGGIRVERSDGQPFETRNRVTLCNCGHSRNRPLCDGTHRREAEELGRFRAVTPGQS
jgi:CDGSH-type Zn-finger protein/uncharacterized Fe-S cluster protein YjdI